MQSHLEQLTDLLALPPRQRKNIAAEADLDPVLRAGLPAAALRQLQHALSISAEDLALCLGISPRSFLAMSKRDTLDATMSSRVYRIAEALVVATSVFGTCAKAVAWLHLPLPVLGGATPLVKLGTEAGAERVRELLGAIESGIYV